MAAKKAGRRTLQRSSKGTKLYAVRDAKGAFKDIQQYARAHGRDVVRVSRAEAHAAAEKAAKALHQAETTFQGAVRRIEEMIQVGRREFANVREAAKDAVARLLVSTQRGAQAVATEAGTMARKAGRKAPVRKARAAVKRAAGPANRTSGARRSAKKA